MATGDPNAPESHEAGRFGGSNPRDLDQGNDPTDRNRPSLGAARQMKLPAEFADFILEDGRRLEDVLGKSFFAGSGKDGGRIGELLGGGLAGFALGRLRGKDGKGGARARALEERRAQAKRLNQTRAILTGAQGVAGAASTAKSKLSGG